LTVDQLDAIRQFDTCAISNAIEQFGVRLRNEGFTSPGLQCVTGGSPRVLGYAATCRIRTSDPPMTGNRYMDRTDWWSAIKQLPKPRIAVIQDLDFRSGAGSSVGEVHAAILKAFGCAAVITNGTVRDVADVSQMDFPMFARSAAVSHSYTHIVDFCKPVTVFDLEVHSGDLIYVDIHGVVTIPHEIANEVAQVAARNHAKERLIIEACQDPGFSESRLLELIHQKDD
jgi:4-hydroxy-4-methyl-2-oxoglutarate aldolase